jgi:uncharacterized protein YbjT (DUF2867 family)
MLINSDASGDPVHVIGASGRSGQALCRALAARGVAVVALVRSLAKWQATGLAGEARVIELTDHFSLQLALRDALRVVSCAHARHTRAIVESAPEDALMVLLGSTRRFTKWPDAHGLGVLEGERVFVGSGRAGVLLHPTMIYGATGENNVQRLAALLKRLPVVPLPDGGRALVQPIHQDDVVACILSALERNWSEPTTLVVAGPSALPYADFVRAVAAAAGLPAPRLVSVPAGLLMPLAGLTGFIPGVPSIGADEIRRLSEDKAFDVMPMFSQLGVRGRSLADGLALTFG